MDAKAVLVATFGSMTDHARVRPRQRRARRRQIDKPRLLAFEALRTINGAGGYANLVTAEATAALAARDAGFVIELVHGTCRMQGSYDRIIVAAAGRGLKSLQPAVVDVLRLACHQLFSMRVPVHAAVAASVDLAAIAIGERVSGLVNAVVRKLAEHSLDDWFAELSAGLDERAALALRSGHPEWVVAALADALASHDAELAQLLAADNRSPVPMLVVRPGLAEPAELLTGEASLARWSPWGVQRRGNPSELAAIGQGRAGVQDEGSQLVILAASRASVPAGPWLDLCAGPGGKSALLRGLAPSLLVAAEPQPHRAQLVANALVAYPPAGHQVIVADGRAPAWGPATMALVVADVPCSGLGALRRRPESRWRREPEVIKELAGLQRELLIQAVAATKPGGVIAYITCSPHRAETVDVVADVPGTELLDAPALLAEVPQATSRLNANCIQLWPHLHGTDAMFCALLRRTSP